MWCNQKKINLVQLPQQGIHTIIGWCEGNETKGAKWLAWHPVDVAVTTSAFPLHISYFTLVLSAPLSNCTQLLCSRSPFIPQSLSGCLPVLKTKLSFLCCSLSSSQKSSFPFLGGCREAHCPACEILVPSQVRHVHGTKVQALTWTARELPLPETANEKIVFSLLYRVEAQKKVKNFEISQLAKHRVYIWLQLVCSCL